MTINDITQRAKVTFRYKPNYLLFFIWNTFILGLRAGATLQAAEIFVCSREGTSCQSDPLDSNSGKTLSLSLSPSLSLAVNTYKLYDEMVLVKHYKIKNIYHEHILYTFLSGIVYQHFSEQRSLRVNANIQQQRGSAGQSGQSGPSYPVNLQMDWRVVFTVSTCFHLTGSLRDYNVTVRDSEGLPVILAEKFTFHQKN